jgi:hypothetical protein
MDKFVNKLPGSTPVKAFVAAVALCGLFAIPVFRSSETRQGHDYMSSEKPEAIIASQEKLRREFRHKRREQEEAAERSQS